MLENLIKKIKNIYKSKVLPYLAIPILTLPFALSCDKLQKERPYAPVFITQSLPDARENHNYSTKLSAYDKNKDIAKYEKLSGAPWLTVFSDGLMQGTPNDNDTGINSLELKVTDKKGLSDQKTFDLNVQNISTLSGKVYNIETEAPISQANIQIGNSSLITNPDGSFQLDNVSDGEYATSISHPDYYTFNIGNWKVNKQIELDNRNQIDFFKIIPKTYNIDFFTSTCRGRGDGETPLGTKKWTNDLKPKFYIHTGGSGGFLTPTQQEINTAVSRIENESSELTLGFANNTVANSGIIIDNGTNVPLPAFGTPGWIISYWDTAWPSHGEWLNGNQIVSASCNFRLNDDIGVIREELFQTLGVRDDSNLAETIFDNGDYPNITYCTYTDRLTFKILYDPLRSIGNTAPDSNPSNFTFNTAYVK